MKDEEYKYDSSEEDSDVVDPGGIPWDSRDPKKIIPLLIKEADDSDPDRHKTNSQANFMALGPDGLIYERHKGRFSTSKPDNKPLFNASPDA